MNFIPSYTGVFAVGRFHGSCAAAFAKRDGEPLHNRGELKRHTCMDASERSHNHPNAYEMRPRTEFSHHRAEAMGLDNEAHQLGGQ